MEEQAGRLAWKSMFNKLNRSETEFSRGQAVSRSEFYFSSRRMLELKVIEKTFKLMAQGRWRPQEAEERR